MMYVRDDYYKTMHDYYRLEIVMPTIGDIKKDPTGYIPKADDPSNNRLFIHLVSNEIPDINGPQG